MSARMIGSGMISRFSGAGCALGGGWGVGLGVGLGFAIAVLGMIASPAWGSTQTADHGTFGLMWILPFAALLLSIALVPLWAPKFWHRHFGKVAAFWTGALLLPMAIVEGIPTTLHHVGHTFALDYIPFVVLLLTLYTVSGGIRLTGNFIATPAVNTAFLTFGTLIASWIGTTGAAMLLIRPLLRANEGRENTVHTVMFFIFLVANIGGSLTPLGDPPLFLGFLNGIDFFWTFGAMALPMLFISVLLLAGYWLLDTLLYRRENISASPRKAAGKGAIDEPIGLTGGFNILLLLMVITAVFLSGTLEWGEFHLFGIEVARAGMARDAALLAITLWSWKATPSHIRRENHFTWFPIQEIGKLFAAIFITIIPALVLLRSGRFDLMSLDIGLSQEALYFWGTGILSSFLDNAPTYLIFFNMAGGDPAVLMGEKESILLAISCGAVFMGALTYIGNAPNFMVRSIAAERGVAMPHFIGYMAIASLILMPVFLLVTLIWFGGDPAIAPPAR